MRKISSAQHDEIIASIKAVRDLLVDLKGEAKSLQKSIFGESDAEKKRSLLLRLDEVLGKIDQVRFKLDKLVVLEPYVDQLDD